MFWSRGSGDQQRIWGRVEIDFMSWKRGHVFDILWKWWDLSPEKKSQPEFFYDQLNFPPKCFKCCFAYCLIIVMLMIKVVILVIVIVIVISLPLPLFWSYSCSLSWTGSWILYVRGCSHMRQSTQWCTK